jgi:hypothetical protein
MKKKFQIALISFIIILFISFSGCIQQPEKQTENKISTETLDNLSLTINITKTSFSLGETLKEKYIIENKGPPFKAYEVMICRREGYENSCINKGIGILNTGNTTGGYFQPCEISDKGAFCVPDSFTISGTYIYELTVYDCAQIERTLDVNCDSEAEYDKIKSQILPLATTKKTIIVS